MRVATEPKLGRKIDAIASEHVRRIVDGDGRFRGDITRSVLKTCLRVGQGVSAFAGFSVTAFGLAVAVLKMQP